MTDYYDRWFKEEPGKEMPDFFLWLEKRDVPSFTPYIQLPSTKELIKYKIKILNGKFYSPNGTHVLKWSATPQ